jgi:hypothetical protein
MKITNFNKNYFQDMKMNAQAFLVGEFFQNQILFKTTHPPSHLQWFHSSSNY